MLITLMWLSAASTWRRLLSYGMVVLRSSVHARAMMCESAACVLSWARRRGEMSLRARRSPPITTGAGACCATLQRASWCRARHVPSRGVEWGGGRLAAACTGSGKHIHIYLSTGTCTALRCLRTAPLAVPRAVSGHGSRPLIVGDLSSLRRSVTAQVVMYHHPRTGRRHAMRVGHSGT